MTRPEVLKLEKQIGKRRLSYLYDNDKKEEFEIEKLGTLAYLRMKKLDNISLLHEAIGNGAKTSYDVTLLKERKAFTKVAEKLDFGDMQSVRDMFLAYMLEQRYMPDEVLISGEIGEFGATYFHREECFSAEEIEAIDNMEDEVYEAFRVNFVHRILRGE